MADKFLSLIEQRRTYYNLKAESPISDKQIVEIATRILLHSPSSFNCQSTRLVILLHSNHVRFWQIAQDCFRILLPAAEYAEYEKKLKGRQAGYGTILLFEDYEVLHKNQLAFPRFVHHTEPFLEHNNAIQAFNLWTALELEGFGCNLQHLNPHVDQIVSSEWEIPPSWVLKAQLVFGTPVEGPNPSKKFNPIESRLLVPGYWPAN